MSKTNFKKLIVPKIGDIAYRPCYRLASGSWKELPVKGCRITHPSSGLNGIIYRMYKDEDRGFLVLSPNIPHAGISCTCYEEFPENWIGVRVVGLNPERKSISVTPFGGDFETDLFPHYQASEQLGVLAAKAVGIMLDVMPEQFKQAAGEEITSSMVKWAGGVSNDDPEKIILFLVALWEKYPALAKEVFISAATVLRSTMKPKTFHYFVTDMHSTLKTIKPTPTYKELVQSAAATPEKIAELVGFFSNR